MTMFTVPSRITFAALFVAIAISSLAAQRPARPPVVGQWDLTLVNSEGQHLPSWLATWWSGDRVLVGRMVGVVGSVRPISRLEFANDTLRFSLPPQWGGGAPVKLFNGTSTAGWHVTGGENQWKAINGVLTNTQRGGNLVTDQTYGDFKLHVEFKYPPE